MVKKFFEWFGEHSVVRFITFYALYGMAFLGQVEFYAHVDSASMLNAEQWIKYAVAMVTLNPLISSVFTIAFDKKG